MGHIKIGWNKKKLGGLTLSEFKKKFKAAYPEADLESEFYGLFPEKRAKVEKQPPTEKEVLENIKARTGSN